MNPKNGRVTNVWFALTGLLVGSLLLSSCKPTKEETPIAKAAPRTDRSGDDWQRMKDCAAQTDRIAKRAGWVEGERNGNIPTLGWQNHYSPKYARCYILVTYENDATKNNSDIPLLYDELIDAFEGRRIAMCTDSKRESTFCGIESDDKD